MKHITNPVRRQRMVGALLTLFFLSGCTISDPIEAPPPPIFPSATPAEVVLLFQTPTATVRATRVRATATVTATEATTQTLEATVTATPAPHLYTVQANETLLFIATKHAISLDALLAANNLNADSVIAVGQQLIIPSASEIVQAEAQKGTPIPTPLTESGHIIHYVQAGETLSIIAAQYNVARDDLLWANGFRPDVQLVAGDTVIVPQGTYIPIPTATPPGATPVPTVVIALNPSSTAGPTTPTAAAAPSTRSHTVKEGEVAGIIARNYGITLPELVAANPGVNLERLSIGQTITIPSPGAAGSSAGTSAAPPLVAIQPTATPTSVPPVIVTHVVTTGETFKSVAEKYKIVEDVLKVYNLSIDGEPSPGAILQVPLGTPTPTPSPSPAPTLTPTPAPDYLAPVPLLPANGATWVHRPGGMPLQLLWTSTGILKENEFYVVRLRAVDDKGEVLWSNSHWTQNPNWKLSEDTLETLKGRVTLRWDVMVMRRTSPAGQEPQTGVAISNKSPTYELTFINASN